MIKSLTFFAAITALDLVRAINYCSTDLCSGKTHIACGNNGAFGPLCPWDSILVDMTPSLKNAILDSHNTKRNTLASGNLGNFMPAVRMATMRWDDELASLAEMNVKFCNFERNKCSNTDQFKHVGANFARKFWIGYIPSDYTLIMDLIDSWWSKYKDANMGNIDKFSSTSSNPIGQFTVMVADKSIALGCAAIKYHDSSMDLDSLTLICNYAMNNIRGRTIYKSGTAASECSSGKNPQYLGLCSASEKYNF